MYKNTLFTETVFPWAFRAGLNNSRSTNWKDFSLALKLERNNSQHLQNIPLLLEINYLYKNCMRQPLHLFVAQPRASIRSAIITRDRFIVLYKLNDVGQEREFSQSQKNTYKSNIRHGLFQQHCFSQANISFPFVICF